MEVEVGDLCGGKDEDVSWSERNHRLRLVEAELSSSELAKGNNNTDTFVAHVPVTIGAGTDVENKSAERVYGALLASG